MSYVHHYVNVPEVASSSDNLYLSIYFTSLFSINVVNYSTNWLATTEFSKLDCLTTSPVFLSLMIYLYLSVVFLACYISAIRKIMEKASTLDMLNGYLYFGMEVCFFFLIMLYKQ